MAGPLPWQVGEQALKAGCMRRTGCAGGALLRAELSSPEDDGPISRPKHKIRGRIHDLRDLSSAWAHTGFSD